MPQATKLMLTQDSNNHIYIANNEGVLSFDAERWKLYPTSSIVRSVAYFDGVLYSEVIWILGIGPNNQVGTDLPIPSS